MLVLSYYLIFIPMYVVDAYVNSHCFSEFQRSLFPMSFNATTARSQAQMEGVVALGCALGHQTFDIYNHMDSQQPLGIGFAEFSNLQHRKRTLH